MHPGSRIEAVYLCREPVYFRKSISGLSAIVEKELGMNPFGAALTVFVNARRDKLKAIYWHRNGFCLWYKRLEREKFAWPKRLARAHADGHDAGVRVVARGLRSVAQSTA
jgi:transposase